MSRRHPHQCRVCGKPAEPDDPISAQGYCHTCGVEREFANIEQLRNHEGPFFDHWRRRHAAAVGGVLVDDLIERSA